ncbi:MAG: hypothetical protein HY017_00725 [Betaproteobacteria bacterium]|nr:hypothetical protein [Betaproteobacteria bacterium]
MKNPPNHPGRKLYTSELDIDEEHIDAFVNWYAFRHAPDIYQIGFDLCTCYRGVAGDMTILDLYEIGSVDIFDTPQYRSIAQTDPYSAEILAERHKKAHTVYSQVFVAPEPVDARALLNADWISVERFDFTDPDKDRLVDYLDAGEAERILLAGAKRVRLAARTKAGPQHVSHRPHYMLLVEWPQRPSLEDVGKRLSGHFGAAISDQSFFVGYRLYPWPDRKDVPPRQRVAGG